MAKDDITAFLGSGTIYNGRLSFVGSVRIDGQFTGEITSEGTLILGKDAKVEGTIHVNQLVLSGKLLGDVAVTGRTILHKSADLAGTLVTKILIMEEGAQLQGQVTMNPEAVLAKPSSIGKLDIAHPDVRDVDIQ